MNALIAILLVGTLAALMFGLIAINQKIEKPAGAITPKCGSCNVVSCSHNEVHKKGDKK